MRLIYTDSILRVGPFETAKGKIHNDSKRRNVSDRTYFFCSAFRHAFRARAKEVNHVDTMRLSERARAEVKDSFAGTSGLCPSCKGRVDVPKPEEKVHFRRRYTRSSGQTDTAERVDAESSGVLLAASDSGLHRLPFPKKICSRCNREVTLGTHICPHCHTYIANLSDF